MFSGSLLTPDDFGAGVLRQRIGECRGRERVQLLDAHEGDWLSSLRAGACRLQLVEHLAGAEHDAACSRTASSGITGGNRCRLELGEAGDAGLVPQQKFG
jgi:hypothetical protein